MAWPVWSSFVERIEMTNVALHISDLHKVYRNGTQALSGLHLDVEEGEFLALLGPNGAGKSTTIGILSSLVTKTSGTVKIFEDDIDINLSRAKRHLGVVPQEFNFGQFEKVLDIVVTQAGYYGIPRRIALERAEHYLGLLGLFEKRHVIARQLSGGMKRRLMIARALVHEPRILILDEPTAGVDIELRRSMWEFLTQLNRAGTTVILTTHYLEEAETLCRRIAIIDHGRIVENTDMKSLLATLHSETFILDLRQDLGAAVELPGYSFKSTDARTLEVTVPRDKNINDVFKGLSAQGIEVMSLRNKANRLEELFVARVERNLTSTGGQS